MNILFNTTLKDGTSIVISIFPSSFFDTSKKEDTLVINATKPRFIFVPRGETWEKPISEIVKYIPEDEIVAYFKEIIMGMNSINDFFPMMKSGYIALGLKKLNLIKYIEDILGLITLATADAGKSFFPIIDATLKLNLYNKNAVFMCEETVDYLEEILKEDNTNLLIKSDFKKIEESFLVHKNDYERKINLLKDSFIAMVELHLENHIKFELHKTLGFFKTIGKNLTFSIKKYGDLIETKNLKFKNIDKEEQASLIKSEENLFSHFEIINREGMSSEITSSVNEKTANFEKDIVKRYLDLKEDSKLLFTEFLEDLSNLQEKAYKEIDDSLNLDYTKNKFNNELEDLIKKYIDEKKKLLLKIKKL
jgi:hypothetical protein